MNEDFPAQKIWVAFSGQADLPWLKLLRPGFRHCYALLHDGQRWLSFDPMLTRIDLRVHGHVPADFDLPEWLRGRGQTVVPAPVDMMRKKPLPLSLFTCVEAIKRLLGLNGFFILTPWQLYCHLTKITQTTTKIKEKLNG